MPAYIDCGCRGHLRADGFCVVGIFRKKARPPVALASWDRAVRAFFIARPVVLEVVIAEYAHGVNHSVIALGLFDGVLEAMTAGIILAVVTTRIIFLSRVPFFK